MSTRAILTRMMVLFDQSHDHVANCIILGPKEAESFFEELREMMGPLKSDHCLQGDGRWYRGCRVLTTNEPGMWVGRAITPLK